MATIPDITHTPRDPDWQGKVERSFAKQSAMHLIGGKLIALRPGECDLQLAYRDDLCQQHGYLHAGITTTLVDSAAGYAGFTLTEAGTSIVSVEFKVNLLAPGEGQILYAFGRVIKAGKNMIICQGDSYMEKDGKMIHTSTMQQTLMVLNRPEK